MQFLKCAFQKRWTQSEDLRDQDFVLVNRFPTRQTTETRALTPKCFLFRYVLEFGELDKDRSEGIKQMSLGSATQFRGR